ncbi:proline-rich protein 36-like [Hyaena hyaena]|uniref:proline-rich protein 36-like n=1 Tax=Hyaena hyaena TaxID=95912 RepID=UPI0019223271|nr:proline-rich protein 36-like [Hyaena hyaena]XP_039093006.1 proline-rich protein 36-like [Hyaena hyaena]
MKPALQMPCGRPCSWVDRTFRPLGEQNSVSTPGRGRRPAVLQDAGHRPPSRGDFARDLLATERAPVLGELTRAQPAPDPARPGQGRSASSQGPGGRQGSREGVSGTRGLSPDPSPRASFRGRGGSASSSLLTAREPGEGLVPRRPQARLCRATHPLRQSPKVSVLPRGCPRARGPPSRPPPCLQRGLAPDSVSRLLAERGPSSVRLQPFPLAPALAQCTLPACGRGLPQPPPEPRAACQPRGTAVTAASPRCRPTSQPPPGRCFLWERGSQAPAACLPGRSHVVGMEVEKVTGRRGEQGRRWPEDSGVADWRGSARLGEQSHGAGRAQLR